MRISLRKGSTTFHRLPDGKRYGLLEWYPKAKRKQDKDNGSDSEDEDFEVNDDELTNGVNGNDTGEDENTE